MAYGQSLRDPISTERVLQAQLHPGDTEAAEQQLQRGGVVRGRRGGAAVQRVRVRQKLQAHQVTRVAFSLATELRRRPRGV